MAFVVSAAVPSSALAITIGLLGGDVDPILPPITDVGFYSLTGDGCFFLDGFVCAPYEVPNNSGTRAQIDSIDFRMAKPSGALYSVTEIGLFSVGSDSDLPNLGISPLFSDGFTFRLFDPDFLSLDCGPVPNYCRADFFSDSTDVAAVSVVGVNGVRSPVPEPALLALFGSGLAGILARRRSRRAVRA